MATADNAAKRRRLGARVSAGQFALLLDYLLANPVLVRAATDSPLSKEDRTALWDIIVRELNVEGPSVKSRAEWKAFWNARVCAARRRDLDLSGATQRTGGAPRKKEYCPSWGLIPREAAGEGAWHRWHLAQRHSLTQRLQPR
ncbi:hypothetical protein HPB47_024018 [Ixodes persulcatus]|uniref:Uncharacterized protein n=1 Tax=Ixodes persulcatus TaxID=34615 RepID=A0AC60Q5C7_IXOPE|nr:hypothetical protein HPB47_024018 [Ixodes persulcatus]